MSHFEVVFGQNNYHISARMSEFIIHVLNHCFKFDDIDGNRHGTFIADLGISNDINF